MSKVEVKRALVSVSDKSGLVEFVSRLVDAGVEIVSSGGTAAAIAQGGLPVTLVADVTGSPEILGGRVKTLHPKIHGAILANLSDDSHRAELDEQQIVPFQLVVSNLYPFQDTAARTDVSDADIIEQIDIGGPAMVRAAAKNHAWIGVVTSPEQYQQVGDAVIAGGLDLNLRRDLARAAFFHTASYDSAIVNWLERGDDPTLPARLAVTLQRDPQPLKYGENPHQGAARYVEPGHPTWWDGVEQIGGPPASYLNVFDTDAAWNLVHDMTGTTGLPAVAIIKHANPCGVAVDETLADAYQNAYECDSRSAFGGIVAFSHPVDSDTVARIEAAAQADVIIAPGYGEGVVERIAGRRRNTRIFVAQPPDELSLHMRPTSAGWLVQHQYRFDSDPSGWRVVGARQPRAQEMADALVAWRVCGATTSNAIVIVKDGTAWGIGAGQQNRVEASRIATEKAAGRGLGGALASDAFFPFADGIEIAAEAGVAVVIQPGGSIRDEEVINRADELDLAMVFTGERQFRH